jgi:hypothetical protein
MIKQPYYYVAAQVDKLYEKKFDESDTISINKHCEFIADYINACGYAEEEFIRIMMGFDKPPADPVFN